MLGDKMNKPFTESEVSDPDGESRATKMIKLRKTRHLPVWSGSGIEH